MSDLERAGDVSLIAKSKSLVSEEIGFNHVAEDAGFRVVETDLGEWIVQLRPATGPHGHARRPPISTEISTDMSTALGRDVSSENIAAQVVLLA
jgi:L-lactate utilization protein LutB